LGVWGVLLDARLEEDPLVANLLNLPQRLRVQDIWFRIYGSGYMIQCPFSYPSLVQLPPGALDK